MQHSLCFTRWHTLNYCSSELLEDTIYAAGYVVETFANSFAKTIDNTWLQGNAGIGVEGLCDAIEGYDTGIACHNRC
jgi:hypothetical protein